MENKLKIHYDKIASKFVVSILSSSGLSYKEQDKNLKTALKKFLVGLKDYKELYHYLMKHNREIVAKIQQIQHLLENDMIRFKDIIEGNTIKEEVDFDGEFVYFAGYYTNLEMFLRGEHEIDKRTKKKLQDAIKEAETFIKDAKSVLKKL